MPSAKLINTNLDEEQLELVNWFRTEATEFRQFGKELLAFIWTSDLVELKELLLKNNSDYFSDGVMKLEYNGEDIIVNVTDICFQFGIDPKLVSDDYRVDDD